MKFYHGSKNKIDKFILSNEFMKDEAIMQHGPGIYLTTSKDDAARYGTFIYEVEWKPKKRLPVKKTSYPMDHYRIFLKMFIKRAPDWKDDAMNFDENPERGIMMAIDSILESYDTPKERFEQIWYDFYRNDPALYCQNMARVGYDGFIIDKNDGIKHAIVFNPDTLKIIKTIHYDKNSGKESIVEAVNKLEKLTNKKVILHSNVRK